MTNPPSDTAMNALGRVGLVTSLISVIAGAVPYFGAYFFVLGIPAGLVISAIGLTRKPRKSAIAGVLIAVFGFVIIVSYYQGAFDGLVGLIAD